MGKACDFEPEQLVVGIMYTDDATYDAALEKLVGKFGETDCVSDEYSFSEFSRFYDGEMSGEVRKRLVSFEKTVPPSSLPAIKLFTNSLEDAFAKDGNRTVNLDPCLLGHGKFVMATTKGASFRIPLSNGIYADLALVYARKHWVHFFWTYFDIKSDFVKSFLEKVRELYLEKRKAR